MFYFCRRLIIRTTFFSGRFFANDCRKNHSDSPPSPSFSIPGYPSREKMTSKIKSRRRRDHQMMGTRSDLQISTFYFTILFASKKKKTSKTTTKKLASLFLLFFIFIFVFCVLCRSSGGAATRRRSKEMMTTANETRRSSERKKEMKEKER